MLCVISNLVVFCRLSNLTVMCWFSNPVVLCRLSHLIVMCRLSNLAVLCRFSNLGVLCLIVVCGLSNLLYGEGAEDVTLKKTTNRLNFQSVVVFTCVQLRKRRYNCPVYIIFSFDPLLSLCCGSPKFSYFVFSVIQPSSFLLCFCLTAIIVYL